MKKILVCLLLISVFIGLTGCKNKPGSENASTMAPAETVTITVGVPAAPPALPVLHMIDTGALGDNVQIEYDLWAEPELLIAMTQDGKHQMFAFPLTVISTLYNKGVPVRLMNVNTWGVSYFLTSDPNMTEWKDLKGKTIYVPLQSSPPDALTQLFLTEAGIRDDVKIVYASLPEVASLLISGEAEYATLIEPQVTRVLMQNDNVRVAFSFEQEWQRVNNTNTMIPTAGWGVLQSFVDEHPEIAAKFQEEYAKAIVWVNENPEEAAAMAERYLKLPANVVKRAIPNMGLKFKTAVDSKKDLEMFYKLLYDFNPKMIGGAIPDSKMFYNAK